MKNPKPLYYLALIFLLSACANDDDMVPEMPEVQPVIGTAGAFLNGEKTNFLAYAMKNSDNDLIRLELDVQDNRRAFDQNISFSNIPLIIGSVDSLFNYTSPILESRSYCYYTAANGDAILAFYDLVENSSNTSFEITKIDQQTNLIKGTFDITLAIEEGLNPDESLMLEDTIRLTKGLFEVPIRN